MKMTTIAIEEHFSKVKSQAAIKQAAVPATSPLGLFWKENNKVNMPMIIKKLLDLGDDRLADMDKAGIDMQVLQFSGVHMGGMDKTSASLVARESNDILAVRDSSGAIRRHRLPWHLPLCGNSSSCCSGNTEKPH